MTGGKESSHIIGVTCVSDSFMRVVGQFMKVIINAVFSILSHYILNKPKHSPAPTSNTTPLAFGVTSPSFTAFELPSTPGPNSSHTKLMNRRDTSCGFNVRLGFW